MWEHGTYLVKIQQIIVLPWKIRYPSFVETRCDHQAQEKGTFRFSLKKIKSCQIIATG